ncbi:DUF29 domain-containing protein [Thermosynechococcus sp. QKsg1]|uniref:DUF29 domain-containing protein n=1 Tax=unclassified Thermosynechococcus TaxID=2622553 RepID=UPI0025755B6A|nr:MULTISPECIES: DUF29 domain-containing protein [unclassified Thermosynechococcus]WJI24937.1 DUF29 domain-containing protein [Thermosynechococcus sp. B0]WJI27456.1 DUF29 domain-containing protein [Thermosynechococcus sp. B1]WJI29988.1 DUF29 domain-containing protein [Thermosynechococcus sp. B3]WNC87577.1 DUF29 domain-containing protein [Thermosynechococcus sp. QKsg1]
MTSPIKTKPASLYTADYYLWLKETVAQLKAGDFDNLDVENLIEEIESLGRSEKQAIASYLMRLCEHLLKIKYWDTEREYCLRGWQREVMNFRLHIQEILEASPSLTSFVQEIFIKQYCNGRKLFLSASGVNPHLIPEAPEFSLEQALDQNWLPWQSDANCEGSVS